MARKVNQSVWDVWQRRIRNQQRSGLSIAQFCRNEGISRASFHAWKRKLRAASEAPRLQPHATLGGGRPATASAAAAHVATCSGSSAFLQLPLAPVVKPASCIEVALPDGTTVRVPHDNLAALTTIVRVLRHGATATCTSGSEASDA